MPKLTSHPKVELSLTLTLSEADLRALHEMSEYGGKAIVEHVLSGLSRSLAEKHGGAITEFFDTIRDVGNTYLTRLEEARAVFKK